MRPPDRATEMSVFAEVVRAGGFSGAARALGLSPSAVSKLIARLEARLGSRLFRRSTRKLALTPEGEVFHVRATAILADLEAAEREAGAGSHLAGRIRLSSSASYVAHILSGILSTFMDAYPEIDIDIVQSDAVSDLIADRIDVAVRAGPLADSALFSRPLGATPLIVVASPDWIARHGDASAPPAVLAEMLTFSYARADDSWNSADVARRITINDGETMRQLALAGVGPARLAGFTIEADLAAGRLVRLPSQRDDLSEPFHAVYVGRSATLPARVRVLIDHLAAVGRVDRSSPPGLDRIAGMSASAKVDVRQRNGKDR